VIYALESKKDGGNNRHGEPMENWDLWKELLRVLSHARIRVDFGWMRDKDSPILRRVHHDAKAAAKRGGANINGGCEPGWITRSMVKVGLSISRGWASALVWPYR
jgi:hypothetical protein